jgi:hypothetical protein
MVYGLPQAHQRLILILVSSQLSADTLALLQDFRTERAAQQERLNELREQAEEQVLLSSAHRLLSMRDFAEDWNASQFWYDDETATIFAKALLHGATNDTNIAVVSAPSVFIQLKNLLNTAAYAGVVPGRLCLLEFDDRFDIFKDNFVHYDSHYPLRLPPDLKNVFDRVICDPPFLSDSCQTEAATTIRWLLRPEVPEVSTETKISSTPLVIVCTGKVMETLVLKLYSGIQSISFKPAHEQGRLHNEWGCYANFECESWTFVD